MKSYLRLLTFCITAACLCTGCAGALFGNSHPEQSKELEESNTRRATESEEKILDKCLHYIFKRQQADFAKNHEYTHEIRKLQPESACPQLKLSMDSKPDSFTATAMIKGKDSVVKWTVDEKGEVLEQNDMDVDFSL